MSVYAANPAGFSNLRPRMVLQANSPLQTCNGGDNLRPFPVDMPARMGLRLWRTSAASVPMETLLWSVSSVICIPSLFGHRFGAFHAPCGHSLFCFGCAALRVTVSLQILFGKYAEKIPPDPP